MHKGRQKGIHLKGTYYYGSRLALSARAKGTFLNMRRIRCSPSHLSVCFTVRPCPIAVVLPARAEGN